MALHLPDCPFVYIYLIRAVCECWHARASYVVQISGMDEPLEIPVLNDLTMVLGSIAQVQTPLSSLGAGRP